MKERNHVTGFPRIAAVVFCMTSVCGSGAGYASDYQLEAGNASTLSAAAEYVTMDINGELTVAGGVAVKADGITMRGGSILIKDEETSLGTANGSEDAEYSTCITMMNDASGKCGRITVRDTGVKADTGIAATELHICEEGEGFKSADGYLDFLSLENGAANLNGVFNHSVCTGRITVAGTSYIHKRWPRAAGNIFMSGAYRIDLVDDAMLVFDFADLGGSVNDKGCAVSVEGTGTVRLRGSRQSTSLEAFVRKGAVFNHSGPVEFFRMDNKRICFFVLADSGVIGPNVTALKHTNGSADHDTRIRITEGQVITLHGDLEITGLRSYLYGLSGSGIKIDATDAARSFKCNIRQGDNITVEKVGGNEMVVSATTNIPNLKVSEGSVRFTEDCTVENLTLTPGGEIIADGCAVSVFSGAELLGSPFKTLNGGKFVKCGPSRTVIYDPESIPDHLHVADGELAFSKYGLDHKWWRWTFFSVNGGNLPLAHRGLYLFGTNGEWQSISPSIVDPAKFDDPPEVPLEATKCRWWHHSSTNIVAAANLNHCNIGYMRYWFNYAKNGNNIATLSSPVINPDDPRSHVGVEVRLQNTALPITGYNMRTHRAAQYANGWRLEASRNGLDWETVDIRSNQVFEIGGTYRSYDDLVYEPDKPNTKELFHLTGYRRDGLVPTSPISVQVDDGATLDLLAFDDGQPVDMITVDCENGAGVVKGGRIAANGTLVLLNAAEYVANAGGMLPLRFDETEGVGNFAGWTVVIDGCKTNRRVGYSGGRIKVIPPGMVILVK